VIYARPTSDKEYNQSRFSLIYITPSGESGSTFTYSGFSYSLAAPQFLLHVIYFQL